jgi:hypothetical protein
LAGGIADKEEETHLMKRITLLGLLALIALMAVPIASASAATVSGACTLSGTANFNSPLTAQPGANGYSFTGSGSCSGTLNGAPITNAPASASASGSGTLGCSASAATLGTGTLTVNGVAVGFQIKLVGAGTEVAFALTGNSGGAGGGHASFALDAQQAATQCAGAGASSLPFSVQATAANLSG